MPRIFSEKKRGLLTKTLLTMKLTAILLLTTTLQVGAHAVAQRVSLSLKNAPIEKAFLEIKRQTGYSFVYGEVVLKKANPVSVECKNASLEQVLAWCFSNQPLTYTIIEKTIGVKVKEPVITLADTTNRPPPGPGPADIHGTVVDSNFIPLANATITIMGTKHVAQTDPRGFFELRNAGIDNHDVELEVSYVGFQTQTKLMHRGDKAVIIRMAPSTSQLDEIAVVAYGTTTQRYNVGSVATVTAKDIERQPVNNPLEALAGRVAGLQITAPNGAPGAMVLAQIRGQNTMPVGIQGLASYLHLADYNQPLYVIDGIPFAPQNSDISGGIANLSRGATNSSYGDNNPYAGISPLNAINPQDIESISVLKDADATAIYGSRGANGVIIITTKKGKPGKQSLSISINSGPTTAARNVQMMNTQQYLQMRHEALANDGKTASIGLGGRDYDLLLFDTTQNTNWYKKLLGNTAQRTDAHLSLSGGSNNLTYMLGAGYTRSGYNYPGDFADQRYTFNNNLGIRSSNGKLNLGLGTMFSYGNNKSSAGISSFGLINMPPDFPSMLDPSGRLLWSYKGLPFSNLATLSALGGGNLYAGLLQPYQLQTYTLNETLTWGYTILEGLSLGGTLGYSRQEASQYSAIPIVSQVPTSSPHGSAQFGKSITEALDVEPQLKYTRAFGRLTLNATLGGTYQKNITSSQLISGSNYLNDALLNSLAGASTVSGTSTSLMVKYAAAFGRLNLIWDKRYILNLTGNINGSSFFGPDRRFGNFGSAGGGWIFSETKWVKKVSPWLSFGKLTANYGVTGSNAVPPYQYQPNWNSAGSSTVYQGSTVYTPLNVYTPDFHWATKKDYNGHLSLGLFSDWLLIDAGFYLSRTGDQLLNNPLPSQTGFGSVVDNAPYTLQNKGWELSLSSGRFNNGRARKFVWEAPRFNISRNYNKVVKILPNSVYAATLHLGQPTSAIAFVKYLGVDSATGLFTYLKADGKTVTTRPSTLPAYYGGDGNQLIDLAPAIQFGFGDGFSWRGLSVSFAGTFVKQKGYNYLYSVYSTLSGGPGNPSYNQPALLLGKEWQKPGDKASIQKFSTSANSSGIDFTSSTGAITDITYLRISNLDISYQLPAPFIRTARLQSCTIYAHVQNLLTFTNYPVGDPVSQNLYNIPPQRVFSVGLSLNF